MTSQVDYYVRSSVLGGRVVTELDSAGQKTKTHVYAGAEVVAEQDVYAGGAQGLTWKQANPVTGTEVAENSTNGVVQKREYDPFGLELGDSDPYLNNSEPDYARIAGGSFYREGGNPFDGGGGCTIDHMAASCDEARRMLGAGLAEQCRDNNCNPRVIRDTRNGKEYLAPLGRDPQTGNLGYWFRFTTQTSVTVEGKTEMYPGRPQVLWLAAPAAPQEYGVVPPPDFREGINNLLNNPTCANFVSALMYAASGTSDTLVSPTIMGVFDKLLKGGNVVFMPDGLPKGYGGQFTGSFADNNAKIEISGVRSLSPSATPENVRWVTKQTAIYYSQVALGETMHAAGRNGFDDRALAVASFRLTGIKGLPDNEKDVMANSEYFHRKVLSSKCK